MVKTYSPWIEKLKNGRYKYNQRYIDPLKSTSGHVKYGKVSVTLDKKTPQAKREAYAILKNKISDKLLEKNKGSDITLKELTDKYQNYLKITNRSWNTRQRAMSNLKFANQYFKGAIAKNITKPMITRYLEYLLYKRKPRTLSNSSTSLRRVYLSNAYRYGQKYGLVDFNPAMNVDVKYKDETSKKRERIENKYLTNTELRALLGYTKFVSGRMDYYYLFRFMSATGMRLSEATGLTARNIFNKNGTWYAEVHGHKEYHYGALYNQEEKGTIRNKKYSTTKTLTSYRSVQLDKIGLQIFQKLSEGKDPDDFIFIDRHINKPWSVSAVDRYMKVIARKVGISKNLSSHFFRHTYISKLAEKHTPLNVIMSQVGQSDSEITKKIYTHITESERQQLNEALINFSDDIGI